MPETFYKPTSTVVHLTPEANRLLTEASQRSGRSKLQEATVRLYDHLNLFSDIATPGKRFSASNDPVENE